MLRALLQSSLLVLAFFAKLSAMRESDRHRVAECRTDWLPEVGLVPKVYQVTYLGRKSGRHCCCSSGLVMLPISLLQLDIGVWRGLPCLLEPILLSVQIQYDDARVSH
ncbi:hypothetical protein EJ02DRAFT_111967 [Clathrospora elynae]|uniref:Secreted protein n=1 Tax=Clathrospora elynae TaxID=706981 RepID=A0A6A5SBK6_9PLEO|nr:hypothetical protein EJ02DRAFT_111967 [Clathrospora elynae]